MHTNLYNSHKKATESKRGRKRKSMRERERMRGEQICVNFRFFSRCIGNLVVYTCCFCKLAKINGNWNGNSCEKHTAVIKIRLENSMRKSHWLHGGMEERAWYAIERETKRECVYAATLWPLSFRKRYFIVCKPSKLAALKLHNGWTIITRSIHFHFPFIRCALVS